MSDETPRLRQIEELPEAPSDPGGIHSAARSCSVILIIGAVLLLIVCVLLVATVVRH